MGSSVVTTLSLIRDGNMRGKWQGEGDTRELSVLSAQFRSKIAQTALKKSLPLFSERRYKESRAEGFEVPRLPLCR